MRSLMRSAVGSRATRWALLGLLGLGPLSCAPVSAQAQADFGNASLRGQYAVVGTGGDHAAASLGIEIYDGQGRVTRSLLLNERGPDQTRTVVAITGEGTYRVEPSGVGSATIVNRRPDGSTFTSHLDFVIRRATGASRRGPKTAMEVFSMLREPGVAAPLVTFVLTRLPD